MCVRRAMEFHQDGVAAHIFKAFRDYFNNAFPQQWTGRVGSETWPLDLKSLDFSFWGTLKVMVYDNFKSDIGPFIRISVAADNIREMPIIF